MAVLNKINSLMRLLRETVLMGHKEMHVRVQKEKIPAKEDFTEADGIKEN
jgi:hypothetical protein